MSRIALVTYSGVPDLSDDDQILADALRRRGARPVPVMWDDASVAWRDFDVIMVRSTWDYYLRPDAFARWIDAREGAGECVQNPPAVLRWNSSKRYLSEVAARGIDVVPTRFVARGEAGVTLARIAAERGWSSLVVKPVVSAAAFATWRTASPPTAADEERFVAASAERALIVQPLVPEVARDGELSLMFVAGRFSHAVRKRPHAGDFRVQAQHGGSVEPAEVDGALVAAAAAALATAPAPCLYGRVDGCVVGGRFVLMELEVLEPSLFFGCQPAAADRFAEAIVASSRGHTGVLAAG